MLLVGEYDDVGNLIEETVWFGDIPVATLRPNGGGGVSLFYIHTDHLNTPRRISRPSDNIVVWRWDSDPFGTTAANEDPDGDTQSFAYSLRFSGQYYDTETGLHYNYFREYDPATGKYRQTDPIGQKGGVNVYLYALANPVRWIDPFGLDKCDPEAAVEAERRRKNAEEKAIDARKRRDWDALYDAEQDIQRYVQQYLEAMNQASEDSDSPTPKSPPEPSPPEPGDNPPVDPGKAPNPVFDEQEG